MRTLAPSLIVLLLAVGCTAEQTVTLAPVGPAGISGVATVHEAITKSFYIRVDAFVEVDAPTSEMRAAVLRGRCAQPGVVVQSMMVHPRGVGGAADVVLAEGSLTDLAGCSIHVFAGEPEASPRLACGDL